MYVPSPTAAETGFYGLITAAIEDAGKLFGDVASGETGPKAERAAKKAAATQKQALDKTRELHAKLEQELQHGGTWAPPTAPLQAPEAPKPGATTWLLPLLALGGVVLIARRRRT